MPIWTRTHYATPRNQMVDGMVLGAAIRLSGGTWQYNCYDGDGWQDCPDQTEFKPSFKVREVNLIDESNLNRSIKYDLAGCGDLHKLDTDAERFQYQLGIEETLPSNYPFPRYITKVYLNTDLTTANQILLLG